ncbi:BapA prefix-like domain-containing protein [Kalamiella sp. sgz302252]|uniref:BapA/Bap/LapF family prefix-like domain-containing protein n=1 Tax=Pantoea sp. sgz302252 TaxID=3341827 RepID=UPI0036D34613
MAYSGSGRVTIVSLTSGQVLAQLSGIDSQVYALSEPGIVTLQGTPTQISSWTKQEDDLILQQQDGTTTRFQQFFSVGNGTSQLVFQDGSVSQKVQLTVGNALSEGVTALTPVWNTAQETSAASTLSINHQSTSEAVAAATQNTGEPLASPRPTIDTPFGDGWLNRAEKNESETLSGTTGVTGEGQRVRVVIGGVAHWAEVTDEGNWSLTLTPADLKQGFGDGKHAIQVTAFDAAENSATINASYTVDTVPPRPTINTPFSDGILTLAEKQQDETLTGTTGVTGSDQRVRVVIGGVAHWAEVTSEGNWSLTLTPADLKQGFGDGRHAIQITAFDAADNSTTINAHYTVDTSPLAVTIDSPSDDGRIDLNALTSGLTISGTATPGTALNVTFGAFNDPHWNLNVDSSGKWAVTLTQAELQDLAPGDYAIKATVTDAQNVSASTELDVNFYDVNVTPTLTIGLVTTDDIVSAQDLSQPLELNGTASGFAPATNIVVKIGDSVFYGLVDGATTWHATIDADAVAAIADGRYTLEVSADNGTQTASADRNIILYTHAHSSDPTLTFNELTADDLVTRDGVQYYELSGTYTEGALPASNVSLYGGTLLNYYPLTINNDGTFSVEVRADQITSTASFHVDYNDIIGNDEQSLQYIHLPDLPGELGDPVATPHPIIDTPFGEGVLTLAEKKEGETLTGSTGVTGSGQSVLVVIGGKPHAATVTKEGNWSLELTPAILQESGFGEGRHQIYVKATDADGHSASTTVPYIVDNYLPTVTINDLSADNRIDLTTVNSDLTISGTATPGANVYVTFGAFNEPNWSFTADSTGQWSVTLPEADVQALVSQPGNYAIKATVTDAQHVSASTELDVNFYDVNVTPALTIEPVATDDIVSSQDLSVPLELNGSASGLAPGTDVVVKIGDSTFYGQVAGGSWNATIDADAVKALADGKYTLQVSADNGTQTASADRDVTLYTHAHSSDPTLTFNELTADDVVTRDGVQYYELSGTYTEGALPVTDVSLYGGETLSYYPLTIAADNTFKVEIPVVNYGSIEFNELAVTYNDIVGNPQQNLRDVVLPDAPSAIEDTASSSAALVDDSSAAAGAAEENSTDVATAQSSHGDSATQATGTEGNDHFTFSTLDLLSNLNGGAGHDTLELSGSHEVLDFASLGLKVSSVETIDLGASGSNSITLGQKDLLALTDNASEALTLKGADGSTVTLSTAEGGVWSDAGQRTVDGQQFELYHNSAASHEGTLADVLVQHNLQVQTA